jgi:hypothetical protein
MGDLLPILVLAIVGIVAGALFDCITTNERAIRHFPKNVWLVAIVLLPGVGGLLWFTSGRLPAGTIGNHIASGHPAGRGRIETTPVVDATPPRTVAPDDDPEFLAHLAELNRSARAADPTAGVAGTGGRTGGSDTIAEEERLRQWEADLRQREERLRQRGEPPIED